MGGLEEMKGSSRRGERRSGKGVRGRKVMVSAGSEGRKVVVARGVGSGGWWW